MLGAGRVAGRRLVPAAGFSLVEALVCVTVLALLLMQSLPSLRAMAMRAQLKGAADRLRSDMGEARTEAIRRNRFVYVSFTRNSASDWCWGMSLDRACTCGATDSAAADFCFVDLDGAARPLRRVVRSADYAGITLDRLPFAGALRFSPVRPEVLAGSAAFTAPGGQGVRVVASDFGRIRLCSPAGSLHVGGLAVCS